MRTARSWKIILRNNCLASDIMAQWLRPSFTVVRKIMTIASSEPYGIHDHKLVNHPRSRSMAIQRCLVGRSELYRGGTPCGRQ